MLAYAYSSTYRPTSMSETIVHFRRAKLDKIQGGGVAEGQPRFDKGGVAAIFLLLRDKNITF